MKRGRGNGKHSKRFVVIKIYFGGVGGGSAEKESTGCLLNGKIVITTGGKESIGTN